MTVTVTEAATAGGPGVAVTTSAAPVRRPEGPSGDEAVIRSLYADYVDAFLALDGERSCSYLSDEAKDQLVADSDNRSFGDTCEQILASGGAVVKSFLNGSREYELSNLIVQGDRALATFAFPALGGDPEAITFDRIDGQWRIGPES